MTELGYEVWVFSREVAAVTSLEAGRAVERLYTMAWERGERPTTSVTISRGWNYYQHREPLPPPMTDAEEAEFWARPLRGMSYQELCELEAAAQYSADISRDAETRRARNG